MPALNRSAVPCKRRWRRRHARRAAVRAQPQAGEAGLYRREPGRLEAYADGGGRAGLREGDRHQGRVHHAAGGCLARAAEGRARRGSTGIDIAQWSVRWPAGWRRICWTTRRWWRRSPSATRASTGTTSSAAASARRATTASWSGIPYRITTGILHYQKALLEQAGFAQAPQTFAEFEHAALAVNTPPDRYAVRHHGQAGIGHSTPALRPGCIPPADGWSTSRPARSSSTTPKAVDALQF